MGYLRLANKRCSRCKKRKSSSEFYNAKSSKDGLYNYCKPCADHRSTNWRKENLDKSRRYSKNESLTRHYGITIEEWESMLTNQKGLCLLCGEPFGSETPHVDHCHRTGKIRGLLHSTCNTGIGLFDESPSKLLAAVSYLLRFSNAEQ